MSRPNGAVIVPRAMLKLGADEVHVWIGGIARWEEAVDFAYFSDEEQMGARWLRFDEDRRRVLARRLCARALAARYLNCGPDDVSVAHELSGRPYLVQEGRAGLQLSISSEGDQVAVAFCWNRSVGVDLEVIDRQLDRSLMGRVLTQSEIADVLPDRVERFAAYWTRKEAYLKATGIGLRIEPAGLRLPLLEADWDGVWGGAVGETRYSVASWKWGERYAVSVCIAGEPVVAKFSVV